MFADRFRTVKILSALLIVVGLCVYAHVEGKRRFFSLDKLADAPGDYLTRDVICTYQRVARTWGSGDLKDYFRLDDGRGRLIAVSLYPPTKLRQGDWISFKARVVGPKALVTHEYHVHRGRRMKYIVAALALVLLGAYLAGMLRITHDGITFRT